MFPFEVDPRWYETYWLTDQPRRKRRTLPGSLAGLAVFVVLLAGSGLLLHHHFHAQSDASGYQDWEQE